MPQAITAYRGKVKIALKRGNTIIHRSTHNAGLPDMAYLFAKAITGTLDYTKDIPRYIDIGYIVPGTESDANPGDSGVWKSILNNPVSIGGRQYKYDTDLNNWVATFVTTIYAQNLNGTMFQNVIENVRSGNYELQARLCSYSNTNRHYFAKIELDDQFLINLRDASSAIVTWYCELLYDENDITIPTTITGEISETTTEE